MNACIITSQETGFLTLRHIIYGIHPTDTIQMIKNRYYKVFKPTDTDKFYLCQSKTEINDTLIKLGLTTDLITTRPSIGTYMSRKETK